LSAFAKYAKIKPIPIAETTDEINTDFSDQYPQERR
jgi:hypothetical protein